MTSRTYSIFAVVLIMLFTLNSTYALHKGFSERISMQQAETDELIQWKQTYVTMKPVIEQWRSSFSRIDQVKDLSEVYSVIDFEKYGLEVDADTLNVDSIAKLEGSYHSLELYNLCLRSASSELRVSSNNIGALFEGIISISNREAINLQNIRLVTESEQAVAYIDNFCILLRTPDAGENGNE